MAKKVSSNNDNNYKYIAWGAVVLLVLVSLRGVFFTNGQIGHNWDFSFSYVKDLFVRIPVFSIYTWNVINLGGVQTLTIVHLVPNYILAAIGWIFGAVWAVKIFMVLLIFVAIAGFGLMINYLVAAQNWFGNSNEKSRWWIPFGVLYGLSPFLFNDIIGGSWYMWLSYSMIPIWTLAIMRVVRTGLRTKWLLVWLLSTIFVLSSLQNFVLMEVIVLMFLIWDGWFIKRFRIYSLRYVISHLILLLVNLYWILPLSVSFGRIAKNITKTSGSGYLQVKNTTQSFMNIFNLGGYLNRDMYLHALPSLMRLFLVMGSGIALAMIVYVLFGIKNKKDNKSMNDVLPQAHVWFGIFIILVFLVKGGNYPGGGITMMLFKMIPLMSLYRSPQHLMLIPSLLLPVLLAYAYLVVMSQERFEDSRKKHIKNDVDFSSLVKVKFLGFIRLINPVRYKDELWYVIVGLVIIWTSGWWITGDIGHKTLLEQKRDHVDFYELPPGLVKTYGLNLEPGMPHRIMFLPTSFSPIYLPTEWQNYGQGGQPEYTYLKNPTFTEESTYFGKLFNQQFCGLLDFDWFNLLPLLNVRYITLRGDILPMFTACRQGDKSLWNAKDVYRILESDKRLTKVIDGEVTKTYKLKDEYFLPKFYVPGAVVKTKVDSNLIAKVVSDVGYVLNSAIYFNQDEDRVIKKDNKPELLIRRVNPVKYLLSIKGSEKDLDLVFSENYNSNWHLYLDSNNLSVKDKQSLQFFGVKRADKFKSHFWDTWFSSGLDEGVVHDEVNGYANGWHLNLDKICKNDYRCVKNLDGTYNLNLIVEYGVQRWFGLGILLSGLMYILVIWFLVFHKVKPKTVN